MMMITIMVSNGYQHNGDNISINVPANFNRISGALNLPGQTMGWRHNRTAQWRPYPNITVAQRFPSHQHVSGGLNAAQQRQCLATVSAGGHGAIPTARPYITSNLSRRDIPRWSSASGIAAVHQIAQRNSTVAMTEHKTAVVARQRA